MSLINRLLVIKRNSAGSLLDFEQVTPRIVFYVSMLYLFNQGGTVTNLSYRETIIS